MGRGMQELGERGQQRRVAGEMVGSPSSRPGKLVLEGGGFPSRERQGQEQGRRFWSGEARWGRGRTRGSTAGGCEGQWAPEASAAGCGEVLAPEPAPRAPHLSLLEGSLSSPPSPCPFWLPCWQGAAAGSGPTTSGRGLAVGRRMAQPCPSAQA